MVEPETEEQILNVLNLIKENNLRYMVTARTGRDIEDVARDTERDNFMTAEEALQYGLIDRIIDTR